MFFKAKPMPLLEILRGIAAPQGGDIVSAGLVESHALENGEAIVVLSARQNEIAAFENLARQIETVLLNHFKKARVILTAEQKPPPQSSVPPQRGHAQPREKLQLPHIKNIIAVASGKGGVGKSTVAVNIAAALAHMQSGAKKVGLLDADIYGPSQARLLGITGRAQLNDNKKLIPFEKFGMKMMSMAVLADPDAAMIWRGPMVQTAILQMLRDVAWTASDETLDYLIIDLPPGTGDAQLTLAQSVPLNGAIIVSTPQDLALIDARKGLAMFRKLDVPIIGIIENMSYFSCPHCSARSDIFAHGGARHEAEKDNVPFLGEIPLHMDLRRLSDDGTPIVLAEPDSEIAKIFHSIAARIISP